MERGRGTRGPVVVAWTTLVAACGSGGVVDRAVGDGAGGKADAGASAGGVRADGGGAGTAGVGGASGRTSSGGVTGSGSVTGSGGARAPVTPYGACIAYFEAQCNRRFYECQGAAPVEHPCPDIADECPDALFSDGSARTPESVMACAETWKTYPCSEVYLDHFPACASGGERAAGEPCLYASQCASNHCSRMVRSVDHPDCGTCVDTAGPGEPCSNVDGPSCGDGYECACTPEGSCAAEGTCNPIPAFGLPVGSPCSRWGACEDGARCFPDPADPALTPTCQRLPVLGEPCPTVGVCAKGAYCDADRKCAALPHAGSACAVSTGYPPQPPSCDDSSYCDTGAGPSPVCVTRAAAGAPCSGQAGLLVQDRCAEGLWCACSDAACTTARCLRRLDEGSPCGSADATCPLGTTCRDGTCVAAGLQGVFAARCGP